MHGIGGQPSQACDPICKFIQERHPGTLCIPIDAKNCNGDDSGSYDLNLQTASVKRFIVDEMSSRPDKFVDGLNLICHSQGGLICRALISMWDNHSVKTFVSLASPQQGVDGFGEWKLKGPMKLVSEGLEVEAFYTSSMQSRFSWAGYWKDILQYDDYQMFSVFLAVINNEAPADRCTQSGSVFSECDKAGCTQVGLLGSCVWPPGPSNFNKNPNYKANFAALEHAIFAGSPQDGVIVPWQSTLWGYYGDGETDSFIAPNRTVVPFAETVIGRNRLVPIQEMMDNGKVSFCELPGVPHTDWLLWSSNETQNERVMACYIHYLH